ncbi:MAG: YvcK family protein [Candidatus Omnitrophota bacterium]|nr:YvcK family protein [Candidatus Omnitrophota bacterium]
MKRDSNIFLRVIKWFYPGMRVKRWVGLLVFAVALVALSSARFFIEESFFSRALYILVTLLGVFLGVLGLRNILSSFINVFVPGGDKELVDMIYRKRYLEKGPRIVTVGGGTGLSVLLQGLKEYTSNIAAVVTVADDGGSSGRIRQQFDILPPGDIRNCLVALADAPTLMQELFQFRFDSSSELSGHSFGNLFITVMTKLTGDFEKAVKESSKVLAIRGQVIPSTLNKISLVAKYKDGSIQEGETAIPNKKRQIANIYLNPPDIQGTPDAIKAISEAQAIILGPGSLYTSVIPNLLIKEIREAILASSALKIYISNVMTQPGETDGYTAYEHIRAIIEHSSPRIIDYCVVNSRLISQELLEKYQQDNSFPVLIDIDKIRHAGYRVIEGDLVNSLDYVRHDSEKLAKIVIDLIQENF